MARPIVLTGAHIVLYINNKKYKTVQSVSMVIEYEEEPIFGIDASYPQEIASNRVFVRGSIGGIRIKYSGGLQAHNIRPLFTDILSSPYISIRIQDRSTGEDIVFIPKAKTSRETHNIVTKASYKLNFDFVGQAALMALDRSEY